MIEEIDVEPRLGGMKSRSDQSGTLIRITALSGPWDKKKLQGVIDNEFSKLTDPFVPKSRYPISVSFNGSTLTIPNFDKLLLKYAHAVGTMCIDTRKEAEDGPRFTGRIDYKLRSREKSFSLEGDHLRAPPRSRTPACWTAWARSPLRSPGSTARR